MVARFSQPPTLGEFIANAKRYDSRNACCPSTVVPLGPDAITYLWRDPDHFAELPSVRERERLSRLAVEHLCRQLGIPLEDFGLGD